MKLSYKLRNLAVLIIIIKILVIINNISCSYANDEAYTQHLPKQQAVPGGIAIVPLDLDSINLPVVFYNNKQVLVIKYNYVNCQQHNNYHPNWLAIIGIPMTAEPGLHTITVFLDHKTTNTFKRQIEKSFLVAAAHYPIEKLALAKKFVTPAYRDQIRINKENLLIKQAYQHRSLIIPNLNFQQPITGRRSSPFGLRRILNGQTKGFHSGLDLAAPMGTEVFAASSGEVILTGNFFYTGNSIFIDHGQGVITSYAHLATINVNIGDLVNQQTIIGTVGSTGRSTGPHLHWGVSLNDTRVNPELFI